MMNVNDMMSEPDINGFEFVIDEISERMRGWVEKNKVDHFLEKIFHKEKGENTSREKIRIETWLRRCQKYKNNDKESYIENVLNKFNKVGKNWECLENRRNISLEDKKEIISEFLSFSILRMSESYNVMYYEVLRSSIVPKVILEKIKREMAIPFGKGSVGYVARSGYPLNIGNTYCDTRGAVGIEDYQLGNISFMACPVFEKNKAEGKSSKRLICVIACFYPAVNAFNDKHEKIFPQFQKIVEDFSSFIELAWKLEQQKAVNRKLSTLPTSQTVATNIVQSYEISLKALLPNEIDQEGNDTTDKGKENGTPYIDPLGLSVATVWEVDEKLNCLRFIQGNMSEEIYRQRFPDVLRKSNMLPSWKSDDQTRAECYLNNLQSIGQDSIVWDAQNQDDPRDKGYIDEKIATKNKSARTERIIKAYSEDFKKIRDLIVPLIKTKYKIGLLRINCIYSQEELSSICKLRKDVKELADDFIVIADFIWLLQKRPDNKEITNYYEIDKIGRELEITFANLVVDYFINGNDNVSEALRQFLHIVEDVFETYKSDLCNENIGEIENKLKEKITKVGEKLPKICCKLQESQEIIIAISIWLNREKRENDEGEIVLKEDPSYVRVKDKKLEEGYILDCSGNDDEGINHIRQEFFKISTFEAEKKFIKHLIQKIKISPKKIILQPLVSQKKGKNYYELNVDGMVYGSMLAIEKKEEHSLFYTGPEFNFLYIIEKETSLGNKEYISIHSKTKLKKDQIKIFSESKEFTNKSSNFPEGIYLKCIWIFQHCQEPAAFKCKKRKVKKLFFDPRESHRIPMLSLHNYNLDLMKHSIYKISNDEENGIYFTNINKSAYEKTYYHKLLEDLVRKHNNTPSPCVSLIDIMGLRFVFCQPIFVNNNLRAVIFLYSLYTDPFNEDISLFEDEIAQGFIRAATGFLRQQITLLDTQQTALNEAIKTAAVSIMSQNMSHNIGSHALYWLEQDERRRKEQAEEEERNEEENKAERAERFYSYLRERMDFVATTMYMPGWTVKKVDHLIEKINENQLLLSKISLSEKINKVTIYCTRKNNWEVVIPGGNLGAQAFYAILENVIRDAAKYGNPTSSCIELTVSFSEPTNTGYHEDYLEVLVYDNCGNYQEASERIQKALNDLKNNGICDKNGRLIPWNLGVKERYIAAALLRGIQEEELVQQLRAGGHREFQFVDEPHILDIQEVRGNLAWKFYLLKPKDILVIKG